MELQQYAGNETYSRVSPSLRTHSFDSFLHKAPYNEVLSLDSWDHGHLLDVDGPLHPSPKCPINAATKVLLTMMKAAIVSFLNVHLLQDIR